MPTARHHGRTVLLLCLLVRITIGVGAQEHPLQPPERSSPRATLHTFLTSADEAFRILKEEYPANQRLALHRALAAAEPALRTLDLSHVPPSARYEASLATIATLYEVLSRIELPSEEDIPGSSDVEGEQAPVRWIIPHTEIVIERVNDGPDTGNYLFSPDTVARATEFYDKTRHLPYRRAVPYPNVVESTRYQGGWMVPLSWIEALPAWARRNVGGQAVWKWPTAALVAILTVLLVLLVYRLSRRHASETGRGTYLRRLIVPLAILAVTPGAVKLLTEGVNLTGTTAQFVILGATAVSFLASSWAIWIVGTIVAEGIIFSSRYKSRSVDSQLLRLGIRLITLVLVAFVLLEGAQRVGIPSYSVLAGLGVGGFAIAFAARDSLANLVGSLVIMFERPFRVGDWVKVGEADGMVEEIGFRSTRIRTFYNSRISVPSSVLVNAAIDNMGARMYRRVKTYVRLGYDTPPDKIEEFIKGVRSIIRQDPETRKDYFHVVLENFGPHSHNILLYFFFTVPDWPSELIARQRVLLKIVRLMQQMNLRFALPTHTLHVESMPSANPLSTRQNKPDEESSS